MQRKPRLRENGRFAYQGGRKPRVWTGQHRKPRQHVRLTPGAPFGIRHRKAEHTYDVVQQVRRRYERDGLKPRHLRKLYPSIPIDTLRDWIHYRTRILA
jgi:hypothetical protein